MEEALRELMKYLDNSNLDKSDASNSDDLFAVFIDCMTRINILEKRFNRWQDSDNYFKDDCINDVADVFGWEVKLKKEL